MKTKKVNKVFKKKNNKTNLIIMATKLTAQLSKKLTSLGISVKTEEAAREKLLAILAKEGIDGMEGEETEILIDMAESFIDSDDVEEMDETEETNDVESEEEPAEEAKEDEIEALADEVEAEDANNTEEELTEEEEEPTEEEELTEEEDLQENSDVKETPKKEVKKKEKAVKERKMGAKGMKLNPKNIAEDRKYFEPLKEFFPDGDFEWNWITSSGITIKSVGKNGKRGVYSIDASTLQNDNSITCNLYLMTFGKSLEKLEEFGLDYKVAWSGVPFIKNITLDEAIDIIKQTYDDTMAFVGKIDKRLGDNRKKMEKSIQQLNKAMKKK